MKEKSLADRVCAANAVERLPAGAPSYKEKSTLAVVARRLPLLPELPKLIIVDDDSQGR